MNKIYKVIWSKAKHTYVVASEIAKGHTKGETTGKGLKKLAAAMLVAAALLSPSFAWAEDTVTVTDTDSKPQTVYTKEGAKNTFATIENLSTVSTEMQTQATQVNTNATNIIGLTNRVTVLETADKNSVTEVTGSDAKLTITKGDGSTSEVTIDNVNHATSADSATTAESATKATQDGNGNEISTTYATKTELSNEVSTLDGTSVKASQTVGQNLNALDERITNVKEYVLSETVSKTDAAVQDGAVVKAANTIGDNVTKLDAALAKETAARLGADAAQDKVIKQVNDNLVASVNTINESVKTTNENMAAGFTALSQADAAETAAREAADTELNERITNEANAIHDEIKAGDTALDERITNVKEYVLSETVSKTDAAVQDGAVVKAANTIGENVTNLDAALAKETAARLGADAAQDKVIQQVNDNAAAGIAAVNNALATQVGILNQNDATERAERMAADAAETDGRVAADTALIKATNGGLALNDKNVLQKNETTIAEDGTVTTKTEAADTLIMNEGKTNQITLSENGIKVGLNSTVQDANGFYAGGDTADKAYAALNADGSIKGANGAFTVDKSGNVTSNGTVTGKTLTDGIATLQNGNLNTTGNVNAHDIVATGDISGKAITGTSLNTQGGSISGGAITGTSLNTQGGAINGGAITGTSINGTTGTFGSLTTTGNASVGGTLTANGINNTGNTTTDSLTVKQGATVGGNLAVTGDITGTGLDVGAGTIKTTGAVETGTLTTTGNADIGGDLTVKGKLNVDEIDLTKTGIDDDYYVASSTKVAAGEITSYKKATSTKDGSEKESSIDYDEKGTSTWAKSTDADGNWNKSTLTVEGNDVTSKVVDSNGNKNESIQTASASNSSITGTVEGKNYKSYITQNLKNILQGIQNGTNESIVDQTETGIKSTATDGTKTASTNLSNGGFNTYATDGTNKTYTLQTAESLTSQIGDDGKVKSVMNADGITNNADGGTITNSAKDLVNTATGDITNTAKNGTITNEAKDLVNKASGDMTNTVGGKLLNDVTGDMENKVGGNQTTTVTGDSSLTAENINNEAKNKITNKALDVETDAKSSIVNKVANDAGSNTSTQLSYQTTEKMSQADGKTASYLRGAAEEKSQLTDGDKKTTIDTIAGQTNTNITDGKNISNNLQKADKIASSVTDGKNTTVVDQKAGSLASSITDGTKVNNTSSTVDKSEQLIKVDDTHFYAETKTVDKAEEALKSGTTLIDIVKDTKTATVSSAVTDGKTITGISQNAKDINLSAADGTIANSAKNINNIATEKLSNSAKDIENKASNSILNQVGENTSWNMTDGTVLESIKGAGGQTNTITDTADSTVQNVKNGKNKLTSTTSSTNADLTINNGSSAYTKVNSATGNKETVAEGKTLASTNLTKNGFNVYAQDENGHNTIINNASGTTQTIQTDDEHLNVTTKTVGTSEEKLTSGKSVIDVLKSFDDKGNPAATSSVTDGTNTSEVKQTASEVATSAKDISNTATEKITSQIGDGSKVKSEMTADGITNTATKITNITGNNKVTSDTNGTTFENTDHSTAIKEGTVTKTTISGNTMETGLATMDYADVMKDLGVRGNATVDGNTTLGKEGADTTLTVNSTSTFNKDVTMKSNATVEKDLTVKGDAIIGTNANNTLTVNSKSTFNNGVTVKGGTTTDTLKVTGTSEFGGAATFNGEVTFKEAVSMDKDLSVGGNVDAASYTVKGTDIKIDENGINAGNQVIKNVGQGDISEGSHDAVSGGQLYETNTRVSGLETRMGTVETRVDKLDNKIDKVGANAAAMANLHPLEFDEDSKWNIAAAVGSSGSETASAVGVFYRPNENVMVNASAAMGTGENMFGGGVSLRLGHGGNKAKEAQMKAAAKENRELRAKVDDLTARMDALLSVLNPNMSKDFPDVPENHWAYEAVSRLAGNGIVEGYEDGKYHGERQMTRYEMAEIIYNALSKGAKAEKKLVEEFRPELQAMAAQKKA